MGRDGKGRTVGDERERRVVLSTATPRALFGSSTPTCPPLLFGFSSFSFQERTRGQGYREDEGRSIVVGVRFFRLFYFDGLGGLVLSPLGSTRRSGRPLDCDA